MHVRILMVIALLGCSKDEGGAASSRDGLVSTWKKGGLQISPLSAATVAFGKDCQSGTANTIDVLVCQYPTPAEASAAAEPGLQWVGDATGTSQAFGKVLVAAADRRKTDPSGRTINQLMKLAKK